MTADGHLRWFGRRHGPRLPEALATRPVDRRRRLPIPYVSEHERDGREVVDFTAINGPRVSEVGRQRRCGLCGTALGYWIAFLGGPASARHLVMSIRRRTRGAR